MTKTIIVLIQRAIPKITIREDPLKILKYHSSKKLIMKKVKLYLMRVKTSSKISIVIKKMILTLYQTKMKRKKSNNNLIQAKSKVTNLAKM